MSLLAVSWHLVTFCVLRRYLVVIVNYKKRFRKQKKRRVWFTEKKTRGV